MGAAFPDRRPALALKMDSSEQKAYGALPNMTYIIDPEGTIIYHNHGADIKAVALRLTGVFATY